MLLSACGGGGGGDAESTPFQPVDCSVAGLQNSLGRYMDDWYFWYAISPKPSPGGFGSVASYFDALLYTGSSATFPDPDRWSGFQSTESFNRFFGDGQALGYGVAVAGLEVAGQPNQPLLIRYIEPQSPAAGVVQRGERVISINGVSTPTVIANEDYSGLTANAVGDRLTLVVRNAAGNDRTVVLAATVFDLTPVQGAGVITSQLGRKIGYVMVKDMIAQAASPLDAAFANFRAQGAQDVVLDLRYNGGGLVSTAATLASYVAGSRAAGQSFARLLYNDRKQSRNQDFLFSNPASWAGVSRVYVLAGERTCSASEQVINGLRGIAGVQVIAIGDTTCGKPVGFLPQGDFCGTTYSVVNFESVNSRNEGRYFNGLAATCAVAEDFSHPIGDLADPLLTVAGFHADNADCPAGTAVRDLPQSRSRSKPHRAYDGADGGERTGMSAH
jgi:hypothetical protein